MTTNLCLKNFPLLVEISFLKGVNLLLERNFQFKAILGLFLHTHEPLIFLCFSEVLCLCTFFILAGSTSFSELQDKVKLMFMFLNKMYPRFYGKTR